MIAGRLIYLSFFVVCLALGCRPPADQVPLGEGVSEHGDASGRTRGGDYVLISSYGHIDHKSGSVKKLDLQTRTVTTFIPEGTGGLANPEGMIIGLNGHLLVVSAGTNSIKEYDLATGAYIREFASGHGLYWPRGLCFDPAGNLYVANQWGGNILEFDGRTGEFIKIFAVPGNPEDVAYKDGVLYVSDIRAGAIIKYDIEAGAKIGILAKGLRYAQGMCWGPDGSLYVGCDGGLYKIDPATGAKEETPASGRIEDVIFYPSGQSVLADEFHTGSIQRYALPTTSAPEALSTIDSPTYMLYVSHATARPAADRLERAAAK